MRWASLCSGIDAPAVAWGALGWQQVFKSEIELFPKAILAHHTPDVPDLGDMTNWHEWPDDLLAEVAVLIAGTPCQSFSIAGLRNSLDDERGNLALEFVRICNAIDHLRRDRGKPGVIIIWENVPGVFSTKDNAFGNFLAALVGGETAIPPTDGKRKWSRAGVVSGPERSAAWRTLDAQFFGVAQRRRRVFVIACPPDAPHPAAILFESEGVRRDSAPSRETREEFAESLTGRFGTSGADAADACARHLVPDQQPLNGPNDEDMSHAIAARDHKGVCSNAASNTLVGPRVLNLPDEVCGALSDGAHYGGGSNGQDVYNGRVFPAIAFNWQNGGGYGKANDGLGISEEHTPPQSVSQVAAVAFQSSQSGVRLDDVHATLDANNGSRRHNGAVIFKASHYTRGKDGAPSEVCPPLSAEADRGDQDLLALQTLAFKPGQSAEAHTLGEQEEIACTLEGGGGGNNRQAVVQKLYSIMPMNSGKDFKGREVDVTQPIMAAGPVGGNQGGDFVAAFAQNTRDELRYQGGDGQVCGTLSADVGMKQQTFLAEVSQATMAVRRLTPIECERLQGFPDDYTTIAWRGKEPENCPDGPRYKALGNSMAVPVIRWLGERIQAHLEMEND